MLIKLLPEQVAERWGALGLLIEDALPPIASGQVDRMTKVLESLLVGTVECWVSKAKVEGGFIIDAVITTTFIEDSISGGRSILLYTVSASAGEISDQSWAEGFAALTKYGRANGCDALIAYSQLDKIKDLAVFVGGDASYSFITVPIKED